ncbi:centromere protein F-like [Chanos chanos]|uniref:Centromere protein F-like n=1 Tax=Chanos chanos TaxID=29144 RepID=A0A6J2URF7_CHACN|nr:centromere protein F-like [Chanos chanos]
MQTARTVTDGLQHTDQLMLSSTSSKGQDEHKNTNDDTVQNSDPDSCVSNEHKSVTSSEALGTRDALPVENTTAKDLVRSCVTIQQSTGKVTDNTAEQISGTSSDANTDKHVEQPDVKEFQHVPPENLISPDAIALKRVTEELLEAQNELIVLRTENEKLTLKLNEMCEEELQSVRQENELLKSKLKAMETESHPVQEPVPTENSVSSHLTPEYEDPSSIKPDDNRDGATLGREELQTAPESDPDKSTPEVQHESFSSAQIHCLQEQVQSMQAQIQSLAEENKRQVEELEFWRQTDLSPGETVDHHGDSGTIVLVREDQLLLSCSSNRILAQNRDTRTMVIHQSGPTEPNHLSSTQPVPDDQQKLCGACGHSNKSSGSTQEVVAQDSCKTTKVNISPKIDTMTVNNNNDAQPGVLDTDVAGGNSENSFRDSQLKTKSTEQADKDELQTALVIPEPETKANADSRQNNQQDTSQNVSGATERKAKVIDANQNNVLSETDDPQKSDLSGQEPEWKGTADLAQDRDDGEKTTPLQNDTAKVNKGESFVPAEGDRNWAPVQSAEVLESPGGRCLEGKDLREMRSLGTQTEEWEGENRGSSHIPREGQTLLHVSTQTEAEDPEKPRQEEEEEDGEEEAADSPPLSPALVTDAEKLLFSGSFPIPADPVHLAERIRRSRTRMSAAYDDTEYEPYGLPEVVMKGFADIPSGPACPYVLRRGLLGTEAVPLPLREQKEEEEEKEQDP